MFDQQLKKKNDLPVGWPLFSSPWYMMPRAQVRLRSLEENKTDLASLIRVSVIHVALWFTGVPIAYGRGSNRTNITVMSDTVSWRFTVGKMRFRSAFQRNTTWARRERKGRALYEDSRGIWKYESKILSPCEACPNVMLKVTSYHQVCECDFAPFSKTAPYS